MNVDYSFDPNEPNSTAFLSGFDKEATRQLQGLEVPNVTLDPADTALQYRQGGFDAREGLIQRQADSNWQDAYDQNYNDSQAALYGLSQRGLAGTPMGEAAMGALERRNAARGADAAGKKATASEQFQMQTMAALRDRQAKQEMADVDREFQRKMTMYQQQFQKLRQTTEWKITDDAQRRTDQQNKEFQAAQNDIMSAFETGSGVGGFIGGALGAIGGGIGGFFLGGPMGAAAGAQAGYTMLHGVGAGIGTGIANDGTRGRANAFRYGR